MLKSAAFETPLGRIYAEADSKALHYLGFVDHNVPRGKIKLLDQIKLELEEYFRGERQIFETPIFMDGSSFQTRVWKELQNIPFGKTQSYKDIAVAIDNPKASRAVGNANGANPFIIIVPCHRVIQADGALGGYSAGLQKKEWLLAHEVV